MGRRDKPVETQLSGTLSTGARLRLAREQKGIALSALAEKLSYSKSYLSGIETGKIPKFPETIIQLYERELELEMGSLATPPHQDKATHYAGMDTGQQAWFLPHQPNRFFTGRTEILKSIYENLHCGEVKPQVLAITGLAGIGKTQLAIEYAYHYHDSYTACLWFHAESSEALMTSYVELATQLALPEQDAQDQQKTVQAVQHWLRAHPGCLVIFDNVNNPYELDEDFSHLGDCHILLTTQMQAMGQVAQTLELEKLPPDESVLLLLRRAKIISLSKTLSSVSPMILDLASQISQILSGLPLALNQAGAYIEETGCGLADYLQLLKVQKTAILKERSLTLTDYTESVATTWNLSFEKIREANAASGELLYLCAFLYPDTIYKELIMDGAGALTGALRPVAAEHAKLNRAIGELRKYSLVRTNPADGTLSIHRLVQLVIQDSLTPEQQLYWAEHTMKLVNRAFPLITVDRYHETWAKCQRYSTQADTCIRLIEQWNLRGEEASQLINKVGKYLEARTQFGAAMQMYKLALRLDKQTYGDNHPLLITDLNNLATLYKQQGDYEQANHHYKEALFIIHHLDEVEHHSEVIKNYLDLLVRTKRTAEVEEWTRQASIQQLLQQQRSLIRVSINDNDEHIRYSGSSDWIAQLHPGDFNGDRHFTSTPGASFDYTFTGIGVEILSDTSNVHGEVEIYLDGEYIQTINTARIPDYLTQTIIFSQTNLEYGTHTLKVVVVRGQFILDALAVFFYEDSIPYEA